MEPMSAEPPSEPSVAQTLGATSAGREAHALDTLEALTHCDACALLVEQSGTLLVVASRGVNAPAAGQQLPSADWPAKGDLSFVPAWEPDNGQPWCIIALGAQDDSRGWAAFRRVSGGELSQQEQTAVREAGRIAVSEFLLTLDHDASADQLTRFSILMKIGMAASANLELEPVLATVYHEVGRLFDTQNFYIALCRDGASEWEWTFHIEEGKRETPSRHPIGAGLTGYVIRTGKLLFLPVFRENQAFLEREKVVVIGPVPKSWMGVPLVAGEAVVGVMAIQSYDREGIYSLDDLELFSAIASQIAMAVRNAQLYEEAERRARETETIAAIGRDLTSSLDLEVVLGRITSNVRSLLTRDTLAIFLKDQGEDSFTVVAADGLMAVPLQNFSIKQGKGILGDIIASARAEIVQNTMSDPRSIHIEGTEPEDEGEKLMAAPLFFQDQVIGVIAAWRRADESPFETEDLAFLEGIGQQASVAIRNAQLFGQSKTAQAEAEVANKAKSSFLASMSHELRTPLNAILLYSELLMEEVRERGIKEMANDLDKIQGAGKHLLGLIDDILDLSKIEAGRMTVFLEDCSVPALLAEIQATAFPLVQKNRNQLVMEADPTIQVLHTDLKKVRQTIYNLLSNAAKFTRDGTISLTVRRAPGAEEQIQFLVSDTGIGMTEEQMQRIFHEFSQAEDSTSRKYGGTGLGLTLSLKFVNLLGGDIRVDSVRGEGTRFIVSLPGLSRQLPPPPPESRNTGNLAHGTVLMIDDDASMRDILSRMLAKEGFRVVIASNGLDGLVMARSLMPRIITLDIEMPGLDGWQVLSRLKADPELKHIPVVVISVTDDRATGFALEAAEYLQKPINREQLMSTLARLVPIREDASILIVEDDEATREGLQRILGSEGMATRCAKDGLDALECLRSAEPSLILLDLMMPGMDGFAVMEALQSHNLWRGIPVVVLTAMELTPADRARLQAPQIHRILRKGTYTRHELVDLVRKFALQNVIGPGSSPA